MENKGKAILNSLFSIYLAAKSYSVLLLRE
uniref:Uncharacterized protein n=1 Tax=Lepeophtheirus salmonis TaxID=72036 RepID=A0A0K2VED3_LEPSM